MSRLTTAGLAGIEADETVLSHVEGDVGRLSYRGYAIGELVDLHFEDVVWLLLVGELPSASESAAFRAWFAEVGPLSEDDLRRVGDHAARRVHPMVALQALLPVVATDGPDAPLPPASGFDEHAGLRLAVRSAQLVAGLLADVHRVRAAAGEDHCLRFLHGVRHEPPTETQRRAFRTVQILQLDHGFNAGTFTARTIASTRASTPAALSGAVGALSGVLHGGADAAALADAREVGAPDRAAAFVDHCLATGRRVMGMGHREYRVVDPRARSVRALAAELAAGTDLAMLYATLEAIEQQFERRMQGRSRALHANLEFYKSIVYLACGVPQAGFTATFATARIFGWVAHVAEARARGTIIRPSARWTGVAPRHRAV